MTAAPAPTRRPHVGEEAAGTLAVRAEREAAREALLAASRPSWAARAQPVVRTVAGLAASLYMFTLALKLLSASARGVAQLLTTLSIHSVPNLIGFGWLAAYGALSGSPVAALALSLLDGGAVTAQGALAMLAGSRMGASLVVLLVGFIAYVRGRGRPDGVYVGVVALLTTIVIYVPATPLALWLLSTGRLDGPAGSIPRGWADLPAAAVRPLVSAAAGHAPGVVLFALGVASLLGAFALFDRLLPSLAPPSPRFERRSQRVAAPRAMFLFGDDVRIALGHHPRAAHAQELRASP